MSDLATLGLRVESQGVDQANASLNNFSATAGKTQRATDAFTASVTKTVSAAREMAEAIQQQETLLRAQATQAAAARTGLLGLSGAYATGTAQARANASAMMTLGQETAAAARQAQAAAVTQANVNRVLDLNNKTVGATAGVSRQARFGLIDLGRQFTDVGVEAAMGINPLMILIQQGPQIADAFAIMTRGGLSVGAALKTMAAEAWAAVLPFLPLIGAVTAVAAAIGSGLLLGARALTNQNYQLVQSLHLTDDQLESLAEKGTKVGVTFGDTLKATFQVLGRDISQALHLDKASEAFGQFLDNLTRGAANAVENIVGVFTGAVDAILASWRQIPAAMGDLIIQGANATLRAITDMLNAAQQLVTGKAGGFAAPQLFNPLEGQALAAGQAARAAFEKGFQQGHGAVQQFFTDVGTQAVNNAAARILNDAGKVRTTHTPTDQSSQLSAQVDQAVAQAQAAQLQALRNVTTDIQARASIESQILVAETAIKDAAIDRQIAELAAAAKAKRIPQTLADDLTDRLNGVKLIQDNVAVLKQQADDQKTAVDLIHQQAGAAQDALQNQLSVLQSQQDLAQYGFQRDTLGKQILAVEQQIELSKAQEALAAAEAAKNEVAIAQARADLAALEKVQANQTKASQDTFLQSYNKVTGALDSMSSAFSKGDYVNASANLLEAMGSAANALGMQGLAGFIGQLGQILPEVAAVQQVSQMVGSALTSAFGGDKKVEKEVNSYGGGALTSFLVAKFNLFGLSTARDDAAKAAAKQQLADMQAITALAYQNLQTATQNYSSAILEFYSASGQAQKGLEEQRRQELQGLDDATAAIKRQTFAWDDYNTALAAANDNVSKAQSDLKDAYDAAAQALQTQIDAVTGAQEELRQAYQAQASDIQDTITQFQNFSDSLASFQQQLRSSDTLMSTPQQSLAMARGNLSAVQGRIAAGDTSALGDVQGVAQALVDAAKASSPDKITYLRQVALAQQAVDQAKTLADSQVDVATQQLDQLKAQVAALVSIDGGVKTVAQAIADLNAAQAAAQQAQMLLDSTTAQVSALITINTSVLTVAQAIGNLQAALAAQAAVTATAPTTAPAASNPGGGSYVSTHGDYAAYVQQNPDLLAGFNDPKTGFANPVFKQTLLAAGLTATMAGFGQFQWEHGGELQNRPVRPFATGGAFANGVVNDPTLFNMGLMGEAGPEAIMPLHRGPDGSLGIRVANDNGWAQVINELEALRQEVASFRKEAAIGRGFLKNIRDLFVRVTRDGNSLVVTDEAA